MSVLVCRLLRPSPTLKTKFSKTCGLLLVAVMFASLSPLAHAGNLAVGSCEPTYASFPTISSAVSAAPVSGSTTIWVCPGVYQEQVVIQKKITLRGVAYNNGTSIMNAAIIEPPNGGLAANGTDPFSSAPIEAMVLVQNTTATVEDLTFDATNNGTTCGQDPVGIFYDNASGTITRNTVLHVQVVGGFGCQGGMGIYVANASTQSQSVTISYNNVHDYDKNGITANGVAGNPSNLAATVTYNTVMGAGAVNDNAQNGIQLWGANGSVTHNIIDGDWYTVGTYAAAGILIISSYAPSITTNTISNTNVGIYLESLNPGDTNNAVVNGNAITATHIYDGIVLCANASTAMSNTINVADESGINVASCADPTPTNALTSNIINGSCAGVLEGPPATATITTDTYYNVTNQVVSSSTDSCVPPPMKNKGVVRSHPQASPAGRQLIQ